MIKFIKSFLFIAEADEQDFLLHNAAKLVLFRGIIRIFAANERNGHA